MLCEGVARNCEASGMAQGEAARVKVPVCASHGGCWQLLDTPVWMREALLGLQGHVETT